MTKLNLLWIFVVFLLVFSVQNVFGANPNNCSGRLDWLDLAIQYEINYTQNYTLPDISYGDFEDGSIQNWSNGFGMGGLNNFINYTSINCLDNYCLNVTINWSEGTPTNYKGIESSTYRVNTNAQNYTGIGFWYYGNPSLDSLSFDAIRFKTEDTGWWESCTNQRSVSWLNESVWKYAYADFTCYTNESLHSMLSNLTAIRIDFANKSIMPSSPHSFLIDNVSLIDYDKGGVFRQYNTSVVEANGRYQEGIYNLAYQYMNPDSDYYQNLTVLDTLILQGDWLVRNQVYNGGWTEYQGGTEGSSASTGFPGISYMKTLILLRNDANFKIKMNEDLTTFKFETKGNGNISTKTRGEWWNETAEKMANYTLNFEFPSIWYSNQYFGHLHSAWLYYNYSGKIEYLNEVNSQLQTISTLSSLNNFGFTLEKNSTSSDVGLDAGYHAVTQFISNAFYVDSKLNNLSTILKLMDKSYLNFYGRPQYPYYQSYIGNSSRDNDYSGGGGKTYNNYIATLLNLTYSQKLSYDNYYVITGSYGTITSNKPYRSTHWEVMDYEYCNTTILNNLTNTNFKFPMNYTTYNYDLFFINNSFSKRVLDNTGNLTNRTKAEVPLQLFAYDDNSSWWIRGDYIISNGTSWYYNDSNGNFTIPIIPQAQINESSGKSYWMTNDGDLVTETNKISISGTSTSKTITSTLADTITTTIVIEGGTTSDEECDRLSSISYQGTTWSGSDARDKCSNEIITLNAQSVPSGVSTITIAYGSLGNVCESNINGIAVFLEMAPAIIVVFAGLFALAIFLAYNGYLGLGNVDIMLLVKGGLGIIISLIILSLGASIVYEITC